VTEQIARDVSKLAVWFEEETVTAKIVDSATGASRPVCVDCGEPFEHTAAEIAARRGSGMPVSPRCPACRIARREERNARVLASLRSGDWREPEPRAVGPSEGGERLYAAICADCRRPIRLPFKPRLDRPIYCRFCHDERHGR
jgi:CxxC-x17-CxxC domain-containing protein